MSPVSAFQFYNKLKGAQQQPQPTSASSVNNLRKMQSQRKPNVGLAANLVRDS